MALMPVDVLFFIVIFWNFIRFVECLEGRLISTARLSTLSPWNLQRVFSRWISTVRRNGLPPAISGSQICRYLRDINHRSYGITRLRIALNVVSVEINLLLRINIFNYDWSWRIIARKAVTSLIVFLHFHFLSYILFIINEIDPQNI